MFAKFRIWTVENRVLLHECSWWRWNGRQIEGGEEIVFWCLRIHARVSWWVMGCHGSRRQHRLVIDSIWFSITSERRCCLGVWCWRTLWKGTPRRTWRCVQDCVQVGSDVFDISSNASSALVCDFTIPTVAFFEEALMLDAHYFIFSVVLALAAHFLSSFLARWSWLLVHSFFVKLIELIFVSFVFCDGFLSRFRIVAPFYARFPVIALQKLAFRFVTFLFGTNAVVFTKTARLDHFFCGETILIKLSQLRLKCSDGMTKSHNFLWHLCSCWLRN